MHRITPASSLLLLGVFVAGCSPSPSPPPPDGASRKTLSAAPAPAAAAQVAVTNAVDDQRLSTEVARFLETWLLKHDARDAVEGRVSTIFAQEGFMPAGAFDPLEYKNRFSKLASSETPGATLSSADFQRSLQTDLEAKTGPADGNAPPSGGLSSLLSPFTPDVAREQHPQLWALVESKSPRPLDVAGVVSLAYQVQRWSDISWTASPTVGYRLAMAKVVEANHVNLQAVVTRLKSPREDQKAPLVVTLWSDEGQTGSPWRLLGTEIPPID